MKKTEYEAYKYVIQDFAHIYIGAKFSYQELLENENVPVKLRGALMQYIMKEVPGETVLTEHLFQMTGQDVSYFAMKQMKAKFKIDRKNEKGKYASYTYELDEIVGNQELLKEKDELVVEEMIINKISLAVMGL